LSRDLLRKPNPRCEVDYGYINEPTLVSKIKPKAVKLGILLGLIFLIALVASRRVGDSIAEHDYPVRGNVSVPQTPIQAADTTLPDEPRHFDVEIPRVAELVALIDDYPAAAVIAESIWRFPMQLVDLAIKNHETIDFVADFLIYGRNITVNYGDIVIEDLSASGTIPHFIQWDRRWGYSYYGTEVMALVGCGPTALSMVAVGLTGNTVYNPRHVADFAQEHGYITTSNDTQWTLMSVGAQSYGLSVREVPADSNAIIAALNRGEPIICSMRAGDFTTAGHFIVLSCANPDGTVNVLDSNSYIKSDAWALSQILPQMRNIWAFSLADS